VAFSGEEIGRLGSLWFVEHPPAELSKAVAMLNLDTVGRVEQNKVIVFGTGTAEEWDSILKGVNLGYGFDLAFNSEGAGASDHASFFAKGIPVLHFFSGAKPEYHRPTDRIELLNFDDLAKLADFTAELTIYLAASNEPLTFRPAVEP
jgi:Zn-dependent M28 family amino/carboxypeptidase